MQTNLILVSEARQQHRLSTRPVISFVSVARPTTIPNIRTMLLRVRDSFSWRATRVCMGDGCIYLP